MAAAGLNEPQAAPEARWTLPTGQAELLRFTTAGSVDDGKSTLIGRLLYDSKGVYEDQLASVRKVTRNQNTGGLDLSLLTDGLRAEREQGITIDVAYRYFATAKRKFIIADTPGHEQYTRNMATGASTANLAIVLIDARHGVLPQSRRHTFIASLLAIPHIVVAVNKIDLMDFREDVFDTIRAEFTAFAAQLEIRDVLFIPVSALDGDNVVTRSVRTPWYSGPSLLEHLESVPIAHDLNLAELRFPVQYVIRPDLNFRGYAGQVGSGTVRPGDTVKVLPSGWTTRVKSIVTWDGELPVAFAPMSVTLCLEDELDISRGDMLVGANDPPAATNRLEASVVWMNQQPLEPGRPYLVKQTTQQVRGSVRAIRHRVDVNTLREEPAAELRLNEIGVVELETHRPLFFDPYRRNRSTGSFILIDPVTNETLGAGMIAKALSSTVEAVADPAPVSSSSSPGIVRVSLEERESRAGHRAVTIWLDAAPEVAYAAERQLFAAGRQVAVVTADAAGGHLPEIARALNLAGAIAICTVPGSAAREREEARGSIGAERFLVVDASGLPAEIAAAAAEVCRLIRSASDLGAASA
jgi:sulfate adenylyltransferase large subunit